MRIALVARELYPFVGGGIAPIVAAAARLLRGGRRGHRGHQRATASEHERLRAAGDPRLPPDAVRIVFVEEPDGDDWAATSPTCTRTARGSHGALREAYPDRGPDLIEFCDYLGEGFVTVQAGTRAIRGSSDTRRLRAPAHHGRDLCAVLDGQLPDDFADDGDLRGRALRPAAAPTRVLWSGGDVLGTYERVYGARRARAGGRSSPTRSSTSSAAPGRDRRPGATATPLRLLYLGRLERRKGVQNLLRRGARWPATTGA